jgi:hypothetical protein
MSLHVGEEQPPLDLETALARIASELDIARKRVSDCKAQSKTARVLAAGCANAPEPEKQADATEFMKSYEHFEARAAESRAVAAKLQAIQVKIGESLSDGDDITALQLATEALHPFMAKSPDSGDAIDHDPHAVLLRLAVELDKIETRIADMEEQAELAQEEARQYAQAGNSPDLHTKVTKSLALANNYQSQAAKSRLIAANLRTRQEEVRDSLSASERIAAAKLKKQAIRQARISPKSGE